MNLSTLALLISLVLSSASTPAAPTNVAPPATPATILASAPVTILDKINAYRATQGLSPASEESSVCNFASVRAGEIATEFNHSGFRSRIEGKALPYTSYSEVTENIAMTSNPDEVVTMWINSPTHAENMRKNTPYICVRSSGNYYAFEGWRP